MIPLPNDPVATLVFFLVVFTAVGVVFLFMHMVMGSFLRPYKPDAEKLTIYECGEPTVGSAWVQFDLRYYVVALLFVIFDVEVAFFFPWATVFGSANQLANPALDADSRQAISTKILPSGLDKDSLVMLKLAVREKKTHDGIEGEVDRAVPIEAKDASTWAKIAFWDIVIFFGVLMVGFAYVWRRGDIDWVRAYAQHAEPTATAERPLEQKIAPQPQG